MPVFFHGKQRKPDARLFDGDQGNDQKAKITLPAAA